MASINKLNFKQRFKIYQGATSYYCTFGDIIQGPQPELITCDYDQKLKAYNLAGKEIFNMDFSSSIFLFFIEKITQETVPEIVTVDVDGIIGLFPIKSKNKEEAEWTVKLSSAITAATTCDFTGRGSIEIVAALEGKRVAIINKNGSVEIDAEFPGGEIKGIAAGDFNGDQCQEIGLLDEHDDLFLMHADSNFTKLAFVPRATMSQLRKIHMFGGDFLLMSDVNNIFYIMDSSGELLLESSKMDADISAITAGTFVNQEIDDVAVCFENGSLIVLEPALTDAEKRAVQAVIKNRIAAWPGNAADVQYEQDLASKFKKILHMSKRVSIEMVRGMLKIDNDLFNEKILGWADQFGFMIDGDYIVLENADVTGFIAELDKNFGTWENAVKKKDGKI